jgi:hypothetical protein
MCAWILSGEKDEVKFMKPGLKNSQNYALVNKTQIKDIYCYPINTAMGGKWRLWPEPKRKRSEVEAKGTLRNVKLYQIWHCHEKTQSDKVLR